MRSKTIFTAAVLSLAAGFAYAQADDGKPAELKDSQHPPIHSEELASPQTPASPAAAAPVVQSEEPGSTKAPAASADAKANASALLTEDQAKAKIESEGFTQISGLKKDAKGMWTASAMKEGKSVQLSLDTQGHIALIN
jgi:hypothetical protein